MWIFLLNLLRATVDRRIWCSRCTTICARKCWMPPADNAPKAWLVWGDEKAGGGFGAWLGAVRPLT